MSGILSIEGLSVRYGPIAAVRDASIDVREGATTALIGSNGAGKSSLLGAVMGLIPVQTGAINLSGAGDISRRKTSSIVRLGAALVPEGRQVFNDLSVIDHLHLGSYVLRGRNAPASEVRRMYELFPRLSERSKQRAGTLSGGEQQMLVIARALISRPRLLLLDEPSLGLAPKIVATIFEALRSLIADEGLSILLVEQSVTTGLGASEYGYVLADGAVVLDGPAGDLLTDPSVMEHYLGPIGTPTRAVS